MEASCPSAFGECTFLDTAKNTLFDYAGEMPSPVIAHPFHSQTFPIQYLKGVGHVSSQYPQLLFFSESYKIY